MRRGWFERNEIGRVTNDWVNENVRLTEREMQLIQIVNDRKLVRRDHLEIICKEYRYLTEQSRTKVINRSINKLFNCMVLDKAHQKQKIGKGNSPAVVAIDKAGSIILNQPHKRRIQHVRKVYKDGEYIFRLLPPNYPHIHMVNDLEVQLILFCEENGYSYKWRLEKDNYYKFLYNQEKQLIIPDALMGIKINGKHLFAWIEADTGSEDKRMTKHFPVLQEKLLKYRKFKMSRLWEDEFEKFPLLLFITSDKKRINWVNKKIEEYGLFGFAIMDYNWISFLEKLVEQLKR